MILFFLYSFFFWRVPPDVITTITFFCALTFFSIFGVTVAEALSGPSSMALLRPTKSTSKRAILVLYHAIAVVSAVVTIIGFLR